MGSVEKNYSCLVCYRQEYSGLNVKPSIYKDIKNCA